MKETQPSSSHSPLIALGRVPCDQCRQRRVRCDGTAPCAGCQLAKLNCKRDYIRKRRGRKFGGGKIITALRAAEQVNEAQCWSRTPCTDQTQRYTPSSTTTEHIYPAGGDEYSVDVQCSRHNVPLPDVSLDGIGLSDRALPALMKQCVDIYLQELYPIMPILRSSELYEMLARPRQANENSMLLALCALVTTFMCRRSMSIFGVLEWEPIAHFFLRGSLSTRTQYDYIQDCSILTLLTSFFLYITHFEFHNIRLCWFYLREAITLAQSLGLHTEGFYHGLDPLEALYCRRIYCILFVTERCDQYSYIPSPILSVHILTTWPVDHLQSRDTNRPSYFELCLSLLAHRKMSDPRSILAFDSSCRCILNWI